VSHDDAPNRDMTHQAPSSSVRSTDMVFTRSTKTLHARASGGTRAAASDRTPAQPRLRSLTRRRAHTTATPAASTAASGHPRSLHGGERPPRPPSHRKRAGRGGNRGGDPAGTGPQTPDPARGDRIRPRRPATEHPRAAVAAVPRPHQSHQGRNALGQATAAVAHHHPIPVADPASRGADPVRRRPDPAPVAGGGAGRRGCRLGGGKGGSRGRSPRRRHP